MSWFWIDVAIVGMFCVCRMLQNRGYVTALLLQWHLQRILSPPASTSTCYLQAEMDWRTLQAEMDFPPYIKNYKQHK